MSNEPPLRPGSCREFIEDLTGHSTRRLVNTDTGTGAVQDIWYLAYKDEEGVLHTVKGSMVGIRRSLKEGLLGDASNVRASRSKSGPFEILRNHPEFRDLVVEPAPVTPPSVRKPIMAAAKPAAAAPPAGGSAVKPAPPPVATPSPVKPAAAPLPTPSPPTGSGLLPLIDLGPPPPRRSWAPGVLIFLLTMAAGLIYLFWPLLRRILL
jgi:hypothetical protein